MNTSTITVPVSTPAQRLSLNKAAAKIAKAYGFEIICRDTYEPNSGKLLVKWSLRHKESDERWDMELFCLAPLWCQAAGEVTCVSPRTANSLSLPRHLFLSTKASTAKRREKHDQLYKAGVANPDQQVDVRGACEPDKVANERVGLWLLIAAVLVGAAFLLPMLLWGMAPG